MENNEIMNEEVMVVAEEVASVDSAAILKTLGKGAIVAGVCVGAYFGIKKLIAKRKAAKEAQEAIACEPVSDHDSVVYVEDAE